jgi:hypothetical protein
MLQGLIGSHDFIWTCCKRAKAVAQWATGYELAIKGVEIVHNQPLVMDWDKFWVSQRCTGYEQWTSFGLHKKIFWFSLCFQLSHEGKARVSSLSLIICAFFLENYEYVPQFTLWSSCPVRSPVLTTVIMRTYETYELNLHPCPEGLSLLKIQ